MSELREWTRQGAEHGWIMPSAPLWKRLPVIRHVRTWALMAAVERHNRAWRNMGAIPSGYDSWVLVGMWHGKERRSEDAA